MLDTEARFETVEMTLNMGPQHPSTHGVFRLVMIVDGEKVMDVDPRIGYLHRGMEKLAEGFTYRQMFTLFDRMDYLGSFNNEMVFAMAVEKLMGVTVPERAEYIRVILSELTRISSHLIFYGAFGGDSGAVTPFLYGFRLREEILAVVESVTGARMMPNFCRVGGVREDLPEGFDGAARRLLDSLRRGIDECDRLLSGNEILKARTKGLAAMTAEKAINYGMSGPTLRASGIAADVRRLEPYAVYDRLDFDVPVGQSGDCYDRYVIRIEEMRQSCRIVEQCLKQIPEGPIMAIVPKTLKPPAGEAYARAENPRGDMGVYLISQGADVPYRVKVRTPSFCNLMALREMMRGCYVADAVVILGAMDIVLGDVDR